MSSVLDNPIGGHDGNYQKWIACSRKRPFGSRKIAKGHAAAIKKIHGTKLGVYNCDHCGQWHLFTERGKR